MSIWCWRSHCRPDRTSEASTSATDFDYTAFLEASEGLTPILYKGFEPLPPFTYPLSIGTEVFMDNDHYKCLVDYYNDVYGPHFRSAHKSSNVGRPSKKSTVIDVIQKMPTIDILGQLFISKMSRHTITSAYVQVRSPGAKRSQVREPTLPSLVLFQAHSRIRRLQRSTLFRVRPMAQTIPARMAILQQLRSKSAHIPEIFCRFFQGVHRACTQTVRRCGSTDPGQQRLCNHGSSSKD